MDPLPTTPTLHPAHPPRFETDSLVWTDGDCGSRASANVPLALMSTPSGDSDG